MTLQVPDIMRVDPAAEREQVARLTAFKHNRDQQLVSDRLRAESVGKAARPRQHATRPYANALEDHCTLGEACGAIRDVFASYQPTN